MANSFIFAFLFCLIGVINNGFAQDGDNLPIARWIDQLSIREDVQTKNLRSVYHALQRLDSASFCRALEMLEQKAPRNNKRCQIRLRAIHAQFLYYGRKWHRPAQYEDVMNEALQMAYQVDDKLLIADMSQIMANLQSYVYEAGEAMAYAIDAADLQDRIGPEYFYNVAFDRYKLGYLLYHTREYEKAIIETKRALEWRVDTVSTGINPNGLFFHMNACNTIGLAYTKLGNYDSAFVAFNHAMQLTGDWGQDFWRGLVQGNIGDIYFQLREYDTATTLLMTDYQLSLEAGQYDNAANSLQWVARIHAMDGNTALAMQQAREAMSLLKRMGNHTYLANTYYTFAEVFNALGNSDSSYYYFRKYLHLHDSLERVAARNQSEIARVMQANTVNIHRIQRLSEAKNKMELIRNFAIALVVLLSVIGFLYLNRQRLKMQLKQREALDKQHAAEAEAIKAKEQLTAFTKNLLEKTQIVEKLQEELLHKESADKQAQLMGGLSHGILTEADWTEFKVLFDQVFPGFFSALKRSAPDITPAEMRIAALIRLELTASESASLLGISAHSARKTRLRLKGRLQLGREDDVGVFIASL